MWEIAASEEITEDKLAYFMAPALFFSANTPAKDKQNSLNTVNAINRYLQYRKRINEIHKDIKIKYQNYISATEAWIGKGKLADKIISRCDTLPPRIGGDYDHLLSPQQRREKAEKSAKQNYMNG